MRASALLISLLVCLAAGMTATYAATLQPSDHPSCDLLLKGEIKVGDAAQIETGLNAALTANPGRHLRLCLDSPGGALRESARLARFIEDNRIGTVIEDGASCLSACSLIFMLGARDVTEHGLAHAIDTGRLLLTFDRWMHTNATLGFHRPSISLDAAKQYSGQDVEAAFRIAILSTLEFMQAANQWKLRENAPSIQADLIEELLKHEGNSDFYYIDTVDKAGRWKIGVFGYDLPKALGAREALTLCDNASNWVAGLAPAPVDSAEIDTVSALTSRAAYFGDGADGPVYSNFFDVIGRDMVYHQTNGQGGSERFCRVEFSFTGSPRQLSVMACGGDNVFGHSVGVSCLGGDPADEFLIDVDPLGIFPSALPLNQLESAARRMERETVEMELALLYDDTICTPAAGAMIGIATQGDRLPLYATPEGDGVLVALADAFTRFPRAEDNPRVTGTDAERAGCLSACAALAEDPTNAEAVRDMRTCIDGGHMRWPLALPDGSTAWGDARLLRDVR